MMSRRHSAVRKWLGGVLALALAAACSCVTVTYPRPARSVTPRAGETLIFGRLRFFYDGSEFFPWEVKLIPTAAGLHTERHLWLLRLGRRAVSAELHPDEDGSLAVWLAPADYALLGSTQLMTAGSAAYEVVALLRVPAGPVAGYAGELSIKTEKSAEGGHVSYGEFGVTSVERQPIEIARATLEQRLGTLPEPPVVSPWCVGNDLPAFDDPELANRARDLLDRGCPAAR
jgi:hypothetical protein